MMTADTEQAIPAAKNPGITLSRESAIGTVKRRIPARARNESWKERDKKYPGNSISVREKAKTSTRIRST